MIKIFIQLILFRNQYICIFDTQLCYKYNILFRIIKLSSIQFIANRFTIFLVNPSLVNTNILDGFSTREQATDSYPWEKHGFSKSKPEMDIVWPWDLSMHMGKAEQTWNCSLLKGIIESKGIIGMRGNRTTSPLNFPVKIVISRIFPLNFCDNQTLHNRGEFKWEW